jgi:hypothetical protein
LRGAVRRSSLTNGFSKKIENHTAAVSPMWYNFGHVHQTLKPTPAVRADVADHVWPVDEIVALLNSTDPLPPIRLDISSMAATLRRCVQIAHSCRPSVP